MSLLRGDAIAIPLADNTVDLIVTSPPYFALRSYTDGGEHYDGQIGSEPTPQDFLEALWAVTAECRRVLKPSGSMWVNLGDKYVADPTNASSTSTGSHTNCSSDSSLPGSPSTTPAETPDAATPPTSKSSPDARTSNGARKRSKPTASTATASTTPTSTTGPTAPAASAGPATRTACVCEMLDWPPSVGPRSVWRVPSEPLRVPEWLGIDHFAAFPQELVRRIILGWSPSGICTACGEGRRPVVDVEYLSIGDTFKGGTPTEGRHASGKRMGDGSRATITGYECACDVTLAPTRPSVILDPFGGTGTVAMVARTLGRYPVHIDLSADYLRLARWRIYQSGHATKSRARTDRENQGTLL